VHWFNEYKEITVNKQVLISFPIRRYNDDILCDFFSMHMGHILLGRLWKFDWKVIHNKFKNNYIFIKDGKIHHPCIVNLKTNV
jgi:hypothetical protein